ncbi:MAG: hypothetical protein H7839_12820 [Magnetococcus sp. YQC-5]
MSYTLIFTSHYDKRAARFLKQHPNMKNQYLKTLKLLEKNPFHPSLSLHALTGRLSGLHAVSINFAYRITLELWMTESEIIPVNVGDHDTVY